MLSNDAQPGAASARERAVEAPYVRWRPARIADGGPARGDHADVAVAAVRCEEEIRRGMLYAVAQLGHQTDKALDASRHVIRMLEQDAALHALRGKLTAATEAEAFASPSS